ncbi:MAG: chloride channel protein [Pseudomonadota bacterium]
MKPTRQNTLQYTAAISLLGLVVGLSASFATIGFVELVLYLNELLFVSPESRMNLEGMNLALVTISVLTLGGLIVGLIMRYTVNSQESAGPADTLYAVQLHERLPSPVSGSCSTIAAVISLGCGASVGQYGPLVYLGTLVGQLTNRLKLGLTDVRNITIACGVAAAISTAFNAPIAGLIFTHEVILRHYSLRMFTAVTIASACGYLVANVIFHHPPLLLIDFSSSFRGIEFFLFAIEGIACGVLAVVFMKLLARTALLSKSLKLPIALKPALAGFLVALVALQIPETLGAGQEVFRLALTGGHYDANSLLLILLAKMLVTIVCIGFGFAGGIIFPSLLIGVLFGSLFALWVPALFLDEFSGLEVYAICGMVALMSPVIGAPMTALLLVFEFTRNYEITIAAMIVIVFSNLVSHRWYGRSLYDNQLAARGIDLSMGRVRAFLMHQKITNLISASLPVVTETMSTTEAGELLMEHNSICAVVIDNSKGYRGLVSQTQLLDGSADSRVSNLSLQHGRPFTQNTSIWDAMECMRDYIGQAIPVVDSVTGAYLGAVPESAVINAYLDATTELRREENEV